MSLDRARSQIESTLSDRLNNGAMAGAEFYRPVVELLLAMIDHRQGDAASAQRRWKQAHDWLAEQKDATADTARFAGEGIDRALLAAEVAKFIEKSAAPAGQ